MKKRIVLLFICILTLSVVALTACEDEPVTYTVTFDSDGGTAVEAQTIEDGQKAAEPTAPTKEGACKLEGWYLGTEKWSFIGYAVTEDITLTAKWGTHSYGTDNKCTKCGAEWIYTDGLEYELSADGQSYSVSGIGTATDNKLIIPYFYENKPVITILEDAFAGLDLTSAVIPGNITTIDQGAFWGCESLVSVTINNGVKLIEFEAFECCTSLTNVFIPNSVTKIGSAAFSSCINLTSVYIGSGVSTIDLFAFVDCPKLQSIDISPNNSSYRTIDGNIYSKDSKTLVYYASANNASNFTIPNDVSIIGESAFYNCDNLTSVTIPTSVTTISDYAFENCDNITNITIPNSVTTIGNYAFQNCYSITNITITSSVTNIGEAAFCKCDNLTTLTILCNGEISIGYCAFYSCPVLTNVILSTGVTNIDSFAFAWCTSLTSIKFRGTQAQWNSITKRRGWDSNTGDYTITYNYTGE